MRRRMQSTRILLVCVLGTTCLGSCFGGHRPQPAYYTLALTLPQPPAAAVTGAKPLWIRRFQAQPPFAQARMAYRTSPYRLDFYNYHLWATLPGDQVPE